MPEVWYGEEVQPAASADGWGGRVLVIGVGNPLRGDDAVGLRVAASLRKRLPPWVTVMEATGEVVSLASCWEGLGRLVIVDAARSGAAPGTVHRFDARRPLPAHFGSLSSHGLGVASAIEMARALGTLPREAVVYAIEGERFGLGEDLSPRAAAAVSLLVDRVLGELAAVPAETGEEP